MLKEKNHEDSSDDESDDDYPVCGVRVLVTIGVCHRQYEEVILKAGSMVKTLITPTRPASLTSISTS